MKHKLQTMLKHKLQWLLLLAALLGVSQGVWGANRDFVKDEYIYFKNIKNFDSSVSDCWITSSGKGYVYLCNGTSSSRWIQLTLYSGTAGAEGAIYRAQVPAAENHKTYVFTRGSSSYSGGWSGSGFWNQSSDITIDTSGKNYVKAKSTQDYYAVAPSSCTMTLGGSHSGSGTSADPYIVEPNESLTFTITATHSDPGMTGVGANVNATGSKENSAAGSSVTVSKSASATGGTDQNWTGYAWAYKNSTSTYSGTYATSSTIYTRTVSCTTPSGSKTITIDESEVCEDTEVTVTVGSSQSGYIYRVYDNAATPNKVGEEESNGGNLDISFTPSASATYTVKAVKMDGCAETEVGANTVSVTVNALPTISLTGTGAVDATHTYPWEWMTVTATTSPSNLTVSWSTSFSGPSGGLENSMEEIGSPNHTYKVKSNRSLSGDQHTMNIDVTGTVTDANGCSNSAMHRFYNNQVPAETCN